MTPEKRIQNKILAYLKDLKEKGYPIFYQRREAGGFAYKKGIPDIYCVVNGRHIEIEVKADNGQLSSMQITYREMFERIGIKYIVAKSVEDVSKAITEVLENSLEALCDEAVMSVDTVNQFRQYILERWRNL